jgi:hypothetical protein
MVGMTSDDIFPMSLRYGLLRDSDTSYRSPTRPQKLTSAQSLLASSRRSTTMYVGVHVVEWRTKQTLNPQNKRTFPRAPFFCRTSLSQFKTRASLSIVRRLLYCSGHTLPPYLRSDQEQPKIPAEVPKVVPPWFHKQKKAVTSQLSSGRYNLTKDMF